MRSRFRVTRVAGGAGLAVVLALVATACGAPLETVGTAQPSGGPASVTRPPSSSPSQAAGGTPVLATLAPPSPGAGDVILDASLLAILPTDLGGIPVTEEGEAFADAANDPAFRRSVARAAFPIVVSGEDLTSGVVAQLISGRFTDQFFRDWRDSYDEGACAQSGGVARNAETELGGRTVYIGTCAGGLRTYHAWLEDRNVIVSLFSVGDGRFGEQLMAGLRP